MLRELCTVRKKGKTRQLQFPLNPQISGDQESNSKVITKRNYTSENTSMYNKKPHGLSLQDYKISYDNYGTTTATSNQTYAYGESDTVVSDYPKSKPIKLVKDNIPFPTTANRVLKVNDKRQTNPTEHKDMMLNIDKDKIEPQPETLNTKPSIDITKCNSTYRTIAKSTSSTRSPSHKHLVQTKSQNSKQKDNDTSSIRTGYSSRLSTLQQYISQIKTNTNGKNVVIEKKANKVKRLQNTVDILTSKIRSLNKEQKYNNKSHRNLLNENDIYLSAGDRAIESSMYINKVFYVYKNELTEMRNKVNDLIEETEKMRKMYIDEDKELIKLKDEVMKFHNLNNEVVKGREGVKNQITMYNNKIFNLKDSITRIENKSEQFMRNVNLLVKESEK